MKRSAVVMAFLRSPEGSGWGAILLFATLLAGFAGYAFYLAMLWSFVESKTAEKGAALQLVDAFVSEYSNLRKELGADRAPVPATFRAHSIELFNQARDSENTLRLRWVGRQGLAIATPPLDRPMADMIESFVGKPNPMPTSLFFTVGGEEVFRTIYPSIARDQSCVDCHNKIQPQQSWKLNDVMGAFAIDAPVGPFLRMLGFESVGFGLAIFMLISGVGLMLSISHYRMSRAEIVGHSAAM